jgi:hypothetical protein
MNHVFYRLPDSLQTVTAFCLWREERNALLFVPPLNRLRGATLVIAERQPDGVFEDSTANVFPIEDWSAAMISVLLMLLVKENAFNQINVE